MHNFQNVEAIASPERSREYSAERHRRHRDPAPLHRGVKTLRTTFFALAACWGFTAGTTAAVIAVAGTEAHIQWTASSVAVLALGAVATVAGGVVASKAYCELKRKK